MNARSLVLALASFFAIACGGSVDDGGGGASPGGGASGAPAGGASDAPPSSSTASLPARASCFADPGAIVGIRSTEPNLEMYCLQQDQGLTTDGKSSGVRTTMLTLQGFHGAGSYGGSAFSVSSTVLDRPEDGARCDVTVSAPATTPLEGGAHVKGIFTCADVHEDYANGTSGTAEYTTSGSFDAEVPEA